MTGVPEQICEGSGQGSGPSRLSSGSLANPLLLLVVALAGAGTMTVELAAVRLIAPWYGASTGVWTNVIGVILLALALGYLIGARLATRGRPLGSLGLVLLIAGVATGWLPYGARPIAELFMPAGVKLEEAASLLAWGSLAASTLLFLPAALALGCVGPLAVEALQRTRGGHAGDAGGRVLCASTLGSIAGTFGTTHVLVPRLGLEMTFIVAALVLALLGTFVLARTRTSPVPGTALGLAVIAAIAFSRYTSPRPGENMRLVEELQSPYQALRVVEREDGMRWLQVNESFDSFQSVWIPAAGLLDESYYYNLFALPPHWAGAGDSWRMLVLGLGAGTAVRVVEGSLPPGASLESVGVEIDPEVVAVGERHFDLERSAPARTVASGLDARAALHVSAGGFDQVVLDCYANNMEIPSHLSTVEFFRELRDALAPSGWVTVNAAGFGLDDPVVAAVARTLSAAFEQRVLALRVPFSRNCVLIARRDDEPPAPGDEGWSFEGPVADRLAPLELASAWRWFEPEDGVQLLTDDRNPIDALQRRSIREGRARRGGALGSAP
ncbi:MAG: hypothetical protein GY711_09600 [bacterium]|nr:hypothetical protein [bacterium]